MVPIDWNTMFVDSLNAIPAEVWFTIGQILGLGVILGLGKAFLKKILKLT